MVLLMATSLKKILESELSVKRLPGGGAAFMSGPVEDMAALVLSRQEGFQVEEIDGEVLLFDERDHRVLHFNPSAALVWGLCDGQRTVAEMTKLLEGAYPNQKDQIGSGVGAAVKEMLEAGVLRVHQ